jgi:dTDP-glucose 4,6-dehydratase
LKRALISGAAGFVGSHLVDRLIKENYFVVGVDNLITGNIKNLESAKKSSSFEFINLDVSKELPKFDRKFEFIFRFIFYFVFLEFISCFDLFIFLHFSI